MADPLLFLDTETTGLGDCRLVELAWCQPFTSVQSIRVKPPIPIEIEASMVNGISNRAVATLCGFAEHPSYSSIKEQVEASIVVAHNAPFDIGVLNREGIYPTKYIDTKRLAIYTFPDVKKHQLQYLRYFLDIEVDGIGHSAGGDVTVMMALFEIMKGKLSPGELDEFVDMV